MVFFFFKTFFLVFLVLFWDFIYLFLFFFPGAQTGAIKWESFVQLAQPSRTCPARPAQPSAILGVRLGWPSKGLPLQQHQPESRNLKKKKKNETHIFFHFRQQLIVLIVYKVILLLVYKSLKGNCEGEIETI